MVSLPLVPEGDVVGSPNVYAFAAAAFPASSIRIGELFADPRTVTIVHARASSVIRMSRSLPNHSNAVFGHAVRENEADPLCGADAVVGKADWPELGQPWPAGRWPPRPRLDLAAASRCEGPLPAMARFEFGAEAAGDEEQSSARPAHRTGHRRTHLSRRAGGRGGNGESLGDVGPVVRGACHE